MYNKDEQHVTGHATVLYITHLIPDGFPLSNNPSTSIIKRSSEKIRFHMLVYVYRTCFEVYVTAKLINTH